MVNRYVLFFLLNGNECVCLSFLFTLIDNITFVANECLVHVYMSLGRMTSPCRLIRLTIISFIVSTVVVFYGLYLASLLRAYVTVMGDSSTACMQEIIIRLVVMRSIHFVNLKLVNSI